MKTWIMAILALIMVGLILANGAQVKSINERFTTIENRLTTIESELTELQTRNQSLCNAVLNLQSKAIEQDAKTKALVRIVHAGRKK